ncbi:MAG: sulfite exporter TauE/SafE family protein [Acidimicrobiia bacterium]
MTAAGLVAVGLVAGGLSAILGIGGGIVFVPALVVLFDFGQHLAQGTSLAVIIPTTIVGAVVHARGGRVDWRLAIPVGAGGIAGGLLGARLALALEGSVLRRIFAAFLVLVAARMLTRAGGEVEAENG